MSSDREEYDMVCQRAVTLIVDLCLHNSTLLDRDTCEDYLFLLSSQGSGQRQPGKIDLMHTSPCVALPLGNIANVALELCVLVHLKGWCERGWRRLCFYFLLCVSRPATRAHSDSAAIEPLLGP